MRTALGHGSSVRVPTLRRIVPSPGGTGVVPGARIAGEMPSSPLHAPVLDWYAAHARDLPWRAPGTGAWAVLVSEVMLQQTPVARVEPVYRAWLERWPLPADLAAEAPGEAVRMWGRLGYPRRALRLHAGVRRGRRAVRRRAAGVVRRTALAARRRGLHRGCGDVVRARRPARGARHQRAAGAGPHRRGCGAAGTVPTRRRSGPAPTRSYRTSPRWRRGGQSR